MMKNGKTVVSMWENNREDGEDSATQVRGGNTPSISQVGENVRASVVSFQ